MRKAAPGARGSAAQARVSAFGVSVAPPRGWEVSIYRRTPGIGEQTYPVLHAATVPLAPRSADYGGGLVERLGPADVFVALLEFGPGAAGTAIFSALEGLPALTPDMYRPRQLQRTLPGQAGVQRFFTAAGRAFSLYSVVGSFANCCSLAVRANQLLASLEISVDSR